MGGARDDSKNRKPSGASSDTSIEIIQQTEPKIKGTGAAEANFSGKAAYQDLLTDENTQRDRPDDVRPMEVPKVDGYGGMFPKLWAIFTAQRSPPTKWRARSEGENWGYTCIDNGQQAERAKTKIEIVSAPEIRSAMMRSNVGRKADDEMAARGTMLPNYATDGVREITENAAGGKHRIA